MTTYFEAPDGHGELTIWEGVRYSSAVIPNAVIRQRDVPEKYWPDVVARMTGTVVTNDDARTAVDGLWEMTRKAAALEQERDQALNELDRLRNTPCFECGHS